MPRREGPRRARTGTDPGDPQAQKWRPAGRDRQRGRSDVGADRPRRGGGRPCRSAEVWYAKDGTAHTDASERDREALRKENDAPEPAELDIALGGYGDLWLAYISQGEGFPTLMERKASHEACYLDGILRRKRVAVRQKLASLRRHGSLTTCWIRPSRNLQNPCRITATTTTTVIEKPL